MAAARRPPPLPAPLPVPRLDDPVGGEHMNIMKAGIITAHR